MKWLCYKKITKDYVKLFFEIRFVWNQIWIKFLHLIYSVDHMVNKAVSRLRTEYLTSSTKNW